jgi:hypothetical protein
MTSGFERSQQNLFLFRTLFECPAKLRALSFDLRPGPEDVGSGVLLPCLRAAPRFPEKTAMFQCPYVLFMNFLRDPYVFSDVILG